MRNGTRLLLLAPCSSLLASAAVVGRASRLSPSQGQLHVPMGVLCGEAARTRSEQVLSLQPDTCAFVERCRRTVVSF